MKFFIGWFEMFKVLFGKCTISEKLFPFALFSYFKILIISIFLTRHFFKNILFLLWFLNKLVHAIAKEPSMIRDYTNFDTLFRKIVANFFKVKSLSKLIRKTYFAIVKDEQQWQNKAKECVHSIQYCSIHRVSRSHSLLMSAIRFVKLCKKLKFYSMHSRMNRVKFWKTTYKKSEVI